MEYLEMLKSFFTLKAGGMLAGAGIALALFAASKWGLDAWDRYVSKTLDHLLDLKNPEDRALVEALVLWAEVKIPDAGRGKEKYALVAHKLVTLFPAMSKYEARIGVLIEEAVKRLDENLKQRIPPTSPVDPK